MRAEHRPHIYGHSSPQQCVLQSATGRQPRNDTGNPVSDRDHTEPPPPFPGQQPPAALHGPGKTGAAAPPHRSAAKDELHGRGTADIWASMVTLTRSDQVAATYLDEPVSLASRVRQDRRPRHWGRVRRVCLDAFGKGIHRINTNPRLPWSFLAHTRPDHPPTTPTELTRKSVETGAARLPGLVGSRLC